MNRTETIRCLMDKVYRVTDIYEKYLSRERNYFQGERLYMREAHLLLEVGKTGEATMSELAQRLEVTPGAVSQLARRIEAKGFIQRELSQMDRRVSVVRLTPKGQNFCQVHRAYDQEQRRRIMEYLSDYSQDELEKFIGFEEKLEQMFQLVEQEEKKGSEHDEI